MKTFELKLTEYLREQGYEIAKSEREVDDLSRQINSQCADLNKKQREEAMSIFEEFFDNAQNMKITDDFFPILKLENEVKVKHLTTKRLEYVMCYAKTLITQHFDELELGGEFNVNIEFLGTYDRGEAVPVSVNTDTAMDSCMVTIEVELF